MSFHRRSPYSYIMWGMNSMFISGSTSSKPIYQPWGAMRWTSQTKPTNTTGVLATATLTVSHVDQVGLLSYSYRQHSLYTVCQTSGQWTGCSHLQCSTRSDTVLTLYTKCGHNVLFNAYKFQMRVK
jgi:hypothetical protein